MSTRNQTRAQEAYAEARVHFARILDRLNTEFEPKSESEQALAEIMAVARWRQPRIWCSERAAIAKEPQRVESSSAFCDLPDHSRTLDILNRHESSAHCLFMLAQRQFKAIRTAKLAAKNKEILNCEANLDIDLSH